MWFCFFRERVGRGREEGAHSIQAVAIPGIPVPTRVRRLFRRRERERERDLERGLTVRQSRESIN